MVNKSWDVQWMEQQLQQYHHKEIINYIKFGWPANRGEEPVIIPAKVNHKGATQFREHIDKYLVKEMKQGQIAGPFVECPFKSRVGVSPISSREKRESNERRIIMDFSWPIGNSVNDGIDKDWYMGKYVKLTYPTVDTLAKHIWHFGVGVGVFKKDMTSAFHQLWGSHSIIH